MTGFFEEKEGEKSYTRLTSFMALIVALLMIIVSVYTNQSHFDLIVALLCFSGGQKVGQKYSENIKK